MTVIILIIDWAAVLIAADIVAIKIELCDRKSILEAKRYCWLSEDSNGVMPVWLGPFQWMESRRSASFLRIKNATSSMQIDKLWWWCCKDSQLMDLLSDSGCGGTLATVVVYLKPVLGGVIVMVLHGWLSIYELGNEYKRLDLTNPAVQTNLSSHRRTARLWKEIRRRFGNLVWVTMLETRLDLESSGL